MRKVSSVCQRHSHYRVARFAKGKVRGGVRLRSAVRLNISVLGSEKTAGTLACKVLDNVNAHTASVVALTRVSLGIFVSHNAPGGSHDSLGNKVFGGYKLYSVTFSSVFRVNSGGDLGVLFFKYSVNVIGYHRQAS